MTEVENNGETTVEEETTEDTLTAEQIADLQEKAAEAEKLREENGSLKRDLKKSQQPKETPKKKDPQPDEPDYSKTAYLNSMDVRNPDDQQAVVEEAERLKLPLTDVLNMEHMKARLKNMADERAAKDGMPDGKGRKGGVGKDSVDYYLAHPDEHPEDLELANKVIDAKVHKEVNANKFSPTLYRG